MRHGITKICVSLMVGSLVAGLTGTAAEAATGQVEITIRGNHYVINNPSGCVEFSAPATETITNHTDQILRLYARPFCASSGSPTDLAPGGTTTGSYASLFAPPS